MSHNFRLAAVPAYLMLCLLLGGASAAGFWANLILQLLGLGLIFWSLVIERRTPMGSPARCLIWLLVLMLTLYAIQLIPLPPAIWSQLSGRETVAAGFRMLDQPLPWLPISLAPQKTLASLLWLIPAIAVLLGIIRLGAFKGSAIAYVLALVTIVSVAVGAMQLAGGALSTWYFYEITNIGAATGFFSNANHQATLLVCTIPFLTALYLSWRSKGQTAQQSSGMLVILAGALMVLAVGIAINGSLAGLGLAVPVIGASILMIASRNWRVPTWVTVIAVIVGVAAVYVPFTAPLGNNLTSADAETSAYSRYATFANTVKAAEDFFPLGSGIGTFVEVYPRYEDVRLIDRTYVNHAHSDYLEIALETGVLGGLILIAFLVWWLVRFAVVWRAEKPDYFARAATLASAAVLAHSVVDYPLRTAAISALFAACCALMADPRAHSRRAAELERPNVRHLSAD
jgi:O-antigen ligase